MNTNINEIKDIWSDLKEMNGKGSTIERDGWFYRITEENHREQNHPSDGSINVEGEDTLEVSFKPSGEAYEYGIKYRYNSMTYNQDTDVEVMI